MVSEVSKAPSQARIHQMLLDELNSNSKEKTIKVAKSTGMNIPTFLAEGLNLAKDQYVRVASSGSNFLK